MSVEGETSRDEMTRDEERSRDHDVTEKEGSGGNETNNPVEEEEDWRYCKYCRLQFTSKISFNMHLRGFGHMQKVMASESGQEETAAYVTPNSPSPDPRAPVHQDDGESRPDIAAPPPPPTFISSGGQGQQPMGGQGLAQPELGMTSSWQGPGAQPQVAGPSAPPALQQAGVQGSPVAAKREATDGADEEVDDRTYCAVCDIKFTKPTGLNIHLRGYGHMQKMMASDSGQEETAADVNFSPPSSDLRAPVHRRDGESRPGIVAPPPPPTFIKSVGQGQQPMGGQGLAEAESGMTSSWQGPGEQPQVAALTAQSTLQQAGIQGSHGAADKGATDGGKEMEDRTYCALCDIKFTKPTGLNMHLRGFGHMQKVTASEWKDGESRPGIAAPPLPPSFISSGGQGQQPMGGQGLAEPEPGMTSSWPEVQGQVAEPSAPSTLQQDGIQSSRGAADSRATDGGKEEVEDRTYCAVCDLKFTKPTGLNLHLRGFGHMQKVMASESGQEETAAGETSSFPSSDPRARVHRGGRMTSPWQGPRAQHQVAAPTPKSSGIQGSHGAAKGGATDGVKEEVEDRTYCAVCDLKFTKDTAYWQHMRGLAHFHRVEALEKQQDPERYEAIHGPAERKKDRTEVEEPVAKKQKWSAAWEKDLQPGDFDTEQPEASFYCEVCEVGANGYKSFKAHLEGTKHFKNVKKLQEAESRLVGLKPQVRGSSLSGRSLQKEIDAVKEPLIGLDYITEYQKLASHVEPRFVCDLCGSNMDPRQLINHVTGFKHRTKYFKYHGGQQVLNQVHAARGPQKSALVRKLALALENREGRFTTRLRIEDNSPGSRSAWPEVNTGRSRPRSALPGLTAQGHVEDMTADPFRDVTSTIESEVIDYGHAKNTAEVKLAHAPSQNKEGGEADRRQLSAAARHAKKILLSLKECEVTNENDAEVALQIANALTQALLDYRMNTFRGGNEVQGRLLSLSNQARTIEAQTNTAPPQRKQTQGQGHSMPSQGHCETGQDHHMPSQGRSMHSQDHRETGQDQRIPSHGHSMHSQGHRETGQEPNMSNQGHNVPGQELYTLGHRQSMADQIRNKERSFDLLNKGLENGHIPPPPPPPPNISVGAHSTRGNVSSLMQGEPRDMTDMSGPEMPSSVEPEVGGMARLDVQTIAQKAVELMRSIPMEQLASLVPETMRGENMSDVTRLASEAIQIAESMAPEQLVSLFVASRETNDSTFGSQVLDLVRDLPGETWGSLASSLKQIHARETGASLAGTTSLPGTQPPPPPPPLDYYQPVHDSYQPDIRSSQPRNHHDAHPSNHANYQPGNHGNYQPSNQNMDYYSSSQQMQSNSSQYSDSRAHSDYGDSYDRDMHRDERGLVPGNDHVSCTQHGYQHGGRQERRPGSDHSPESGREPTLYHRNRSPPARESNPNSQHLPHSSSRHLQNTQQLQQNMDRGSRNRPFQQRNDIRYQDRTNPLSAHDPSVTDGTGVSVMGSGVFQAATDLVANLGSLDFSALSSVDSSQLNDMLSQISSLNQDLARNLPRDVVEAAGAFAQSASNLHHQGPGSHSGSHSNAGSSPGGRGGSGGGGVGVPGMSPNVANLSQALAMHFPAGLLEGMLPGATGEATNQQSARHRRL